MTTPIVIRFGRLGDMVLLAPLLHRLHAGYGHACVLLGTGPFTAPLYAAHPDVARVLQVDARHRPLAVSPQRWAMLALLRTRRDAPVHVCEAEPRALDKIRRMLALAGVARARCTFLIDAPAPPGEHWIDRLLRAGAVPPPAAAAAWHGAADPNAVAPRLFLRPEDHRDGEAWLLGRGWHGEPLWLVQPANRRSVRWSGLRAAADDDKAWPAERWATVLAALHARHRSARIVLCGTAAEAALHAAIVAAAHVDTLDPAAGELPLRRLMALAARAEGMLAVDTGPAHVAAALGCPLVVLFGAASPRVWCPRSPCGSRVVALGGPPARCRVDAISADEVIATLYGLAPRNPELPRAA